LLKRNKKISGKKVKILISDSDNSIDIVLEPVIGTIITNYQLQVTNEYTTSEVSFSLLPCNHPPSTDSSIRHLPDSSR